MPLYLVTGGGGFIGSNIVAHLVSEGKNVRVLDNFSTGKRRNIESVAESIELFEGDLKDREFVDKTVDGVDFVIHEGALPSVPRSVKDPCKSNSVNVDGTLNVLEACRKHDVSRIVFAGSSSAYGDVKTLPKKEDMKPKPLSPYAASKLSGEYYCQTYFHTYGLESVVLRYFNVFGPRQDPKSQYSAVIPRFITAIAKDKKPTVYGNGQQSRDFTYVKNVVDGTIKACHSKKAVNEVINLACNDRITINQLVDNINEILGKYIEPSYENPRPGDIEHSQADISKAKKILEYTPKYSFRNGLEETIEWYTQ